MADYTQLTPDLAVSPQLRPEDMGVRRAQRQPRRRGAEWVGCVR